MPRIAEDETFTVLVGLIYIMLFPTPGPWELPVNKKFPNASDNGIYVDEEVEVAATPMRYSAFTA